MYRGRTDKEKEELFAVNDAIFGEHKKSALLIVKVHFNLDDPPSNYDSIGIYRGFEESELAQAKAELERIASTDKSCIFLLKLEDIECKGDPEVGMEADVFTFIYKFVAGYFCGKPCGSFGDYGTQYIVDEFLQSEFYRLMFGKDDIAEAAPCDPKSDLARYI